MAPFCWVPNSNLHFRVSPNQKGVDNIVVFRFVCFLQTAAIRAARRRPQTAGPGGAGLGDRVRGAAAGADAALERAPAARSPATSPPPPPVSPRLFEGGPPKIVASLWSVLHRKKGYP